MMTSRVQWAVAGLAAVLWTGAARAQDVTAEDKKFIAESSQGSMAEVSMGKLALQKSHDKNVREFAAKMVKDHSTLLTEMKPLAAKFGVKPPAGPSDEQKATYKELQGKSGTDFDRAYVTEMVKDHHDDLKKFIDEEGKAANPQLKAKVSKGKDVIREHTEMIDGIAKQGGISTPPMPQ